MRKEHPVRVGTNLLADLSALLAYLAKRDRLTFARVNEPAGVAKRFGRDRAVLLVYPDGREIPVDPNLLAVRYWGADAIGVSAAQGILRILAAAREALDPGGREPSGSGDRPRERRSAPPASDPPTQ